MQDLQGSSYLQMVLRNRGEDGWANQHVRVQYVSQNEYHLATTSISKQDVAETWIPHLIEVDNETS